LTAHVDFTALERKGRSLGLETLGLTRQALFLIALGLGDRIAAVSRGEGGTLSEVLRRREALHSLIDPMGLGNFGVLVQATSGEKGLQLQGLSEPSR
jgi:SAM-dependent MidA family methyltransferase